MNNNHNKHNAFFWCKASCLSFVIHGFLFFIIMMTFWPSHFKTNKDAFEIVVIPTLLSAPKNESPLPLADKNTSTSLLTLTPFYNPWLSLVLSKIKTKKDCCHKKGQPNSSTILASSSNLTPSSTNEHEHSELQRKNTESSTSNASTQQKGAFFPNPQNAFLVYPKSAYKHKLSGRGTFRLYLSGDGKVKSIEFRSGDLPQCLRQSAEKTLKTWSFYGEVPEFVDVPIRYDASSSSSE
jgi:outer membrane biosynthesis protein TonB